MALGSSGGCAAEAGLPHALLQTGLHVRPFRADDAVDGRVPHMAVRHDHMLPKETVQLCTESLDRRTGLVVQAMGSQFHGVAAKALEGVAEHQELGMGVDEAALPGAGDPGGADLDPMV